MTRPGDAVAALWAEYAGPVPAPVEPTETLERAILAHLDEARPTPPVPPRTFRVTEGDALEVTEQFGYAIQALASQGIDPRRVFVSFVDGNAWVIGG